MATDTRALTTIDAEERAMTVAPSPGSEAGTLALAQMSEFEFEARLAAMQAGRERIAIIQRKLLVDDVDYGKIPGTPKPTLLKPGAEKLLDFYQLRADFQPTLTLGDGMTRPPLAYEVRCSLHLGDISGPVVAVGLGAANSWEKRYRYRTGERSCPKCGTTGSIRKGKDWPARDGKPAKAWTWYCREADCKANFEQRDPAILEQPTGQVENSDPFELQNT